MPTVKDATGEVVAKLPYDAKGEAQAEAMVKQDPSLKVDYAPGGQYDAPSMREQMYAGGGKTGYSEIGQYKKGGKVKKSKGLKDVWRREKEKVKFKALTKKLKK
jgi:hypothetical protein